MDQREVAVRQVIRRFMTEHPGLRALEGGDIPCSQCGQTYPDEFWARVYGDPWEMPELDEFVCDRCRFGDDGDEPLHDEPGWVPHMAPEGPDPDDAD